MKVENMLRKYFILGSQNCDRDPEIILQEAVEAGITAFQFREKGAGSLKGAEKIELAKRLRAICREHEVPFIINDDLDLVEELDVDGIHVGQDDSSVEEIRKRYPELIIGLSISNIEELERSNLQAIDYIGAGPVFTTSTKEDAKKAVGLEWITKLRSELAEMPIVGVGGIDETNAADVIAAGADGVSVISAIAKSKDIAATLAAL
ncbi:MAG TPA: thiamine phosphate synthase [Pseudogracilibacillus sp.]|nr:thiamine phosphate synthase [Pseudogracilibacillus sp.]